ncbi:tryptophan repeat family protein [Faustovirus]|nr:tryptophan repeat family protein [Faustovirus]AMN84459.1 tryptophan repeat family protein [Faustovirus]AMP44399.1 tryptophan repeat family protein [Faustovirus]
MIDSIPSDIYYNIFGYFTSQGDFLNLRTVSHAALKASISRARSNTMLLKINITNADVECGFLIKYSNIINWRSLETLRLHADTIIEFADRLNLNTLIPMTPIPACVIIANRHRINPILLFAHQHIDVETIDVLHAENWIPWQIIHLFHHLDCQILTKYVKYINWNAMSVNNIIPESIMEKFADNFNWRILVKTQRIPAHLLISHVDKYDINTAIMYQDMPNEIIDNNIGAIDWCIYSRYQNVSFDMRKKYEGLICYRCLAHNKM